MLVVAALPMALHTPPFPDPTVPITLLARSLPPRGEEPPPRRRRSSPPPTTAPAPWVPPPGRRVHENNDLTTQLDVISGADEKPHSGPYEGRAHTTVWGTESRTSRSTSVMCAFSLKVSRAGASVLRSSLCSLLVTPLPSVALGDGLSNDALRATITSSTERVSNRLRLAPVGPGAVPSFSRRGLDRLITSAPRRPDGDAPRCVYGIARASRLMCDEDASDYLISCS
jgi:hypothetical protein